MIKDPIYRLITLTPNTKLPILGPLGANIYETGKLNWDSLAVVDQIETITIKFDSLIAEKKVEGKNTKKDYPQEKSETSQA